MDVNAIARQRCEKLLGLAKDMLAQDVALSKRYVSLARKIAMRHRFSLGSRLFCKNCNTIYVPGLTVRVRVSPSQQRVLYTCLSCKRSASFPFAKEKLILKAKRSKRS